jgi:fatty acid desaturase
MNTRAGFSGLASFFWTAAIGVVVLYVFFAVLGAFDPGEVWALTVLIAVLVVLIAIHFAYLRRELDEEGPNSARRQLNAWRERRGF